MVDVNKHERGWFGKAVTACIDSVESIEKRMETVEQKVSIVDDMAGMTGFKDFDNVLKRVRMLEQQVQTLRQENADMKAAIRRLSV